MITLLSHYPYCSAGGGTGGDFTTPWVSLPEGFTDYILWVNVHNHNSGTCDLQLEEGVDAMGSEDVSTAVALSAAGLSHYSRTISGTMARVNLSAAGAAIMTISIYLVPKQS